MAKTSAHTRTYASVKAMANLEVHNTRDWTEDHPAPPYLLPAAHHDPRGNVEITRGLTPEMVIREYLETNRFGQKHGKLHHKAKPLRETVVVCEAHHGREDMNRLMDELERQLPFRCMYGHLHRDEGRIDKETGRPVFNYHMHIGHTNLVDGKLVNPGKEGLRKMQDICAEVLDMERGTPVEEVEEKRPHLTPREYRRMAREKERALAAARTQVSAVEDSNRELARELDIRNQEYDGLKETNRVLSDENARLNKSLRVSEEIRAADEQTLDRLKNDPDLDLEPGLDTIEDLSKKLVETNRQLREQIQESGRGTPAIYKRLKEIKMSDQPILYRLQAMSEYVDELLQDTPAPTGPALADEVVAWQAREQADRQQAEEKVRELEKKVLNQDNLVHHGAETARELQEELAKSEQARTDEKTRADRAEARARELEEDLPESGWVPPKVKARKKKSLLGKEEWELTETAVEFRQRTLEAWRLSLDKQRRADRKELEAEKRKVREDAKSKLNLLGAFEDRFKKIWELPLPALQDLAKEIGATITRFLDRLSRPAPERAATRSRSRARDQEHDGWERE